MAGREQDMVAPCLNCTAREPGCHSECEGYLAYAEERQRERQDRLNARGLKGLTVEHEIRNDKFRKRTGASRRR